MTTEEKQLLLIDLCARLPYGVKVLVKGEKYFNEIIEPYTETLSFGTYLFDDEDVTLVPYLRPLSSMTEEECKEINKLPSLIDSSSETIPNIPYYIEIASSEQIDWLNEHHFDYRNLIEKGLALEAKEGMYKTE